MQAKFNAVTRLLNQWQDGDQSALDELMPMVYKEMHRLAHIHLFQEKSKTLNTTALVHEAYLALTDDPVGTLNSRAHFFAIASRVMRRVLIWHMRERKALKRGGEHTRVELEDFAISFTPNEVDELLSLDAAMSRLEKMDERLCRVVEYRFFGGLSVEETAQLLEVSTATIKRDWHTARTWLKRELDK